MNHITHPFAIYYIYFSPEFNGLFIFFDKSANFFFKCLVNWKEYYKFAPDSRHIGEIKLMNIFNIKIKIALKDHLLKRMYKGNVKSDVSSYLLTQSCVRTINLPCSHLLRDALIVFRKYIVDYREDISIRYVNYTNTQFKTPNLPQTQHTHIFIQTSPIINFHYE